MDQEKNSLEAFSSNNYTSCTNRRITTNKTLNKKLIVNNASSKNKKSKVPI